MRKLFFIFIFFFPLLISAQDSIVALQKVDRKKTDSIEAIKIHSYFAQYGLNPDSAASKILFQQVYEWKGTPYHRAGHTKRGIDCSGFVERMYLEAYEVSIYGGAKGLYDQCDTVPRSELKEGDLLFFKIKKGTVSHVAIYLGNNKFAHATVHGGVMIDDLDEAYYKKYFYCGGRLTRVVRM